MQISKTRIEMAEPRHRIAPIGISSGISVRLLPLPSFQNLRGICEHYIEKCSGKYCNNVTAARYVYEMGQEVLSQTNLVEESVLTEKKELMELKLVMDEWNTYFPRDSLESNRPRAVAEKVRKLSANCIHLEGALVKSSQEKEDIHRHYQTLLDQYAENYRHENRFYNYQITKDAIEDSSIPPVPFTQATTTSTSMSSSTTRATESIGTQASFRLTETHDDTVHERKMNNDHEAEHESSLIENSNSNDRFVLKKQTKKKKKLAARRKQIPTRPCIAYNDVSLQRSSNQPQLIDYSDDDDDEIDVDYLIAENQRLHQSIDQLMTVISILRKHVRQEEF